MKRTDIINYLIAKNNYKTYLEIGLNNPNDNFLHVMCENKESVDPYIDNTDLVTDYNVENMSELIETCLTYRMTSDDMFSSVDLNKKWDIIFVDGLHEEKQAYRDIVNSINHLNVGGAIVVHDCLPFGELEQTYPRPESATLWNGDVWKSFVNALKIDGVEGYTIDTDWGCGVLFYHSNKKIETFNEENNHLTWSDYCEQKDKLLNIISVNDFLSKYEVIEIGTLNINNTCIKFDKYDDKNKNIVFTCSKNEDTYIREFIYHYLKLGFDKVIIANNDDDFDELKILLKDYTNSGFVNLINISGLANFQCQLYQAILSINNFKWCGFFDCDEFLELTKEFYNIKDFLDSVEGDCVCFNWILYGANEQYSKDDGLVQDRFKCPTYPVTNLKENMFVKSIVRGRNTDAYFNDSHRPIYNNNGTYNLGGYYITDKLETMTSWPLRYKNGYIKHYYTKSYEEYLEKISRGWPDNNNGEKLKNTMNFHMLNECGAILKKRYLDSLFSFCELKPGPEVDEYDVIYVHSTDNNIYGVFSYITKVFLTHNEKTIVVGEDMDDWMFAELLQVALMTNNRIVTSNCEQYNLWNIYLKYSKRNNASYYMVNVF